MTETVLKTNHTETSSGRVFLFLLGVVISTSLSYYLYFFVVRDLNIQTVYQNIIFWSIILLISAGFVFTNAIPCIAILTLLEFGSNSGRRCAQGVIVMLVLAGPLQNMGRNGESVIQVVSCFADLAWNVTLTKKDILLLPIQHISAVLKGEIEKERQKWNNSTAQHLLQPLEQEVGSDGEIAAIMNSEKSKQMTAEVENKYQIYRTDTRAERIEKQYSRKLSYRCQDVISKGQFTCESYFQSLYDDCYKSVTDVLGWALCWPLRLDNYCSLESMFEQEGTCLSNEQITNSGFGERVLEVQEGVQEIPSNFSNIFMAMFSTIDNLNNVRKDTVESKKMLLGAKFKRWEKIISQILVWLQRLLTLYLGLIIYKAVRYRRKYLDHISYDNQYITKYFERIDSRRIHEERTHLLPLKNFEKRDYITVIKLKLTMEEKLILLPRILALGIMAVVVGTLYTLDKVFTELLIIFRRDEDFTVQVKGDYVLDIIIEGKGALAQVLRQLVQEINAQFHVNKIHESKPCLPKVHHLPSLYTFATVSLFLFLFILCFCEVLTRRLRHCVADGFYRKRAKRRTLWLYNDVLRRRATQIEIIKRKLMVNAKSKQIHVDYKVVQAWQQKFPHLCYCLRLFKFTFRKCLLCQNNAEVYRCSTCGFSFCDGCYEDMDKLCLYCAARLELLEMLLSSTDTEDSDQDYNSVYMEE